MKIMSQIISYESGHFQLSRIQVTSFLDVLDTFSDSQNAAMSGQQSSV